MIPVQFGRLDHMMFGVFTPAVGKRLRRGAVICNPWGVEAMRAHRSIRMLADILSRGGIDVLRFDYFGTGDSFGNGLTGSLEDWCSDTEMAVDELLNTAGVRKAALIGLRLGGYVSAVAASRLTRHVDRLVLWDPVVEGGAYLAELLHRRHSAETQAVFEVSGYPMPEEFQQELRTVRLAGLPARDIPVLAALSANNAQQSLTDLGGASLTMEVRESAACWLEESDFGAGAVPIELLQAIGLWLKQK